MALSKRPIMCRYCLSVRGPVSVPVTCLYCFQHYNSSFQQLQLEKSVISHSPACRGKLYTVQCQLISQEHYCLNAVLVLAQQCTACVKAKTPKVSQASLLLPWSATRRLAGVTCSPDWSALCICRSLKSRCSEEFESR
jgi:hypothetical protein